MNHFRVVLLTFLVFITGMANGQTEKYIGSTEEFILENVKGYGSVEELGIEHEEFNVLVFKHKGRELSFYFTFFRGAKVCSYIKNVAPLNDLEEELAYIKANFNKTGSNIWENSSRSVQVQINERDGRGIILMKELRHF